MANAQKHKRRSKREETTNLIGKKVYRLTLESTVKTVAFKVYDEQLSDDESGKTKFEQLKERIVTIDRGRYIVLCIRHDRDTLGDDYWKPSIEKPHYHILVLVMNGDKMADSGVKVRTIQKLIGVTFRPNLDDNLLREHGVETLKSTPAYTTYLLHKTEQAMADGKTPYELEEIISNISQEEIKQIMDGYSTPASARGKASLGTMIELDEKAEQLGYELGNFKEWYHSQPLVVRNNGKMKQIRESYVHGVERRVDENSYVTRCCIFIKGEHNDGKTYTSELALKDIGVKDMVSIGGQETGKFDDITPYTKAILVDDDTLPNPLNVADNKMTKLYKRNKDNPYWCGTYLVVTSNLDFGKWIYEKCGITDPKQIEAVRSRFFICETKHVNGKTRLECSSPSKRGTEADQLERKELYMKFRDAFHKRINEYTKSETVNYDDLNDYELRKVLASKLEEIIQAEKARTEGYLKGAYEHGYIGSGQYNEKMKQSEELINLLQAKYYDILLEAQDEKCVGYPAVDYTEDAKRVNGNQSEFCWNL